MNSIDLFYIGDEQSKNILKDMIDLLAKNNIWHDSYLYYVRSGGEISYKDWVALHNPELIQKEAIRLGYKGEIINFN